MIQENSNDFFRFHVAADGVCEIAINNVFLNFEQLSQGGDCLRGLARDRVFRITGRSSTEAYFCLGFWLTHWQVAELIGIGAKPGDEQLRFDLRKEQAVSPKKWLHCHVDAQGRNVAEICSADSENGRWSGEDLALGTPSQLFFSDSGSLHLTGSGSVWMYMQLGISAALAGIRDVFISKPLLPYEIHVTADGVCEACAVRQNSKDGVIVGILGDPNSGKSVFSRNFALTIRNVMPHWFTSWIYDCDLASPTPEWYLNDQEGTGEQRQNIKKKWTPELERKAAADLRILRHNLDLTLADMPGGKKCGEELDRIPSETRAAMMAQCDAFIVLCRQDRQQEIYDAWRLALSKYQLEDRIIARIVSADPEAGFAILSPLKTDCTGEFSATVSGLDRKKDRAAIVRVMRSGLLPLIKHLSYIRVARDAQAACTQPFLTGVRGTRYGAAARSALSGKVFTAGQYSSFNHSTNMHAEMNVLSFAANSGEPDVDVLAIACSKSEKAIPCGVCRQVMLEHAQRTSRDFDVVMATSDLRFRSAKVSELLPDSWQAASAAAAAGDSRTLTPAPELFPDEQCRTGAACWEKNAAGEMLSLIWDPGFTPNSVLKKIKYIKIDDAWRKLPHAFTESPRYQKFLIDHRCNSLQFPQFAFVNRSALRGFRNPRPLEAAEKELLKKLEDSLFAPAGIDLSSQVFVFGSRLLGMSRPDSDHDLIVRASADQVSKLRSRALECLRAGILQLPERSASLRYLNDAWPGPETLAESRRYCESLQYGDSQISLMFVPPEDDGPAFASEPVCLGRRRVVGTVCEDSRAPFKRSESILETPGGVYIRLLCYHKAGNLLRKGDRVAVCGNYFETAASSGTAAEATLLLGNAAVDNIVWMK